MSHVLFVLFCTMIELLLLRYKLIDTIENRLLNERIKKDLLLIIIIYTNYLIIYYLELTYIVSLKSTNE